MSQAFNDLRKELSKGSLAQITVAAIDAPSIIATDIQYDTRLEKLQVCPMRRGSKGVRLDGTRTDIIAFATDWVTQFGDQNILWIYSQAGSRKSSLAMTLAALWEEFHRLGTCLIYNTRDPETFITTLAYKLAQSNGRIRKAISAAIRVSPGNLGSTRRVEFDTFILEPLWSIPLEELNIVGPIVILIGGLDECGTPQSRESLLAVLRNQLPKLPSCYRIVITSQHLIDIERAFPQADRREVDITAKSNADDIVTFLRFSFSKNIARDWPEEHQQASVAVQFIAAGSNRDDQLRKLLKVETAGGAESALELYKTAIEGIHTWIKPVWGEIFRDILGMVIVSKGPITCAAIDELRPKSSGELESWKIISLLGSVILDPFHPHRPVRTHHSFDEYVSNFQRCKDRIWHIDAPLHEYRFALRCLDHLRRSCNLAVEYDPSVSLNVLRQALPGGITYTVSFLLDHVCAIRNSGHRAPIIKLLGYFLRLDFLHWLEILSILGKSRDAIRMLGRLNKWNETFTDKLSLQQLIDDAYRFAKTFADTIEIHPFMVYHSALPFTPSGTAIFKLLNHKMHPWLNGEFHDHWPLISQVIAAHREEPVHTVSFSLDDKRIVSSSNDWIRVWDSETGSQLGVSLSGHDGPVLSVAFIRDDVKRIISASIDCTLRTWDTFTGEEIVSLRRYGAESFTCVACSPDGKRIASGSMNGNIHVWDADQPGPYLEMFAGHQEPVLSVQFSPEDPFIASSSADSTVRLWYLGPKPQKPSQVLKGHNECSVRCVAISPDGRYLVSGSEDCSIQLWDAQRGWELKYTFLGHEHYVTSVAFSPDGKYIASGSTDETIRLWSVEKGEIWKQHRSAGISSVSFSHNLGRSLQIVSGGNDGTVCVWDGPPRAKSSDRVSLPDMEWAAAFSSDGEFFAHGMSLDNLITVWKPCKAKKSFKLGKGQGHSDRISSVAFSPDGSILLSGSQDCSIILWDMKHRSLLRVLSGHTESVSTIAMSRNGKDIVSGSMDCTVRLWMSDTGASVHTLCGHNESVNAVVFSDDGALVASGSDDGSVRIWDAKNGDSLHVLSLPDSDARVMSILFGPIPGQILCASEDRSLQTWDLGSQSCIATIPDYFPRIIQNIRDPLIIRSDSSIEQFEKKKVVSRLTALMSADDLLAAASCATAIAMLAYNGYIHTLCFI